ncbi:MAG: radical SAM protein [Elusimicrobia bacterium]|nr:radical SAM protein [Elusimicrobiota bacterium]
MSLANRLRVVEAFLRRKTRTGGYPTECVLEVSRECNLRCVMHPVQEVRRPTGFMEPAVFETILGKIAPCAEVIYLSGNGEPLMNSHTIDYVGEIRRRGIPVVLATNATLLTPEKGEALLANDVSYVMLPLDGVTKKTYDAIRVNADFDAVVSNITRFLEAKKRLGKSTFVQVQMISMEQNKHEVKLFPEFVKKLDRHGMVNDIRVKPYINFCRRPSPASRPSSLFSSPCFLLWRNLYVTRTGMAIACSQDSHGQVPIGDFMTETLDGIWNSKAMQDLRRLHLEGKGREHPICNVCDLDQNYFTPVNVLATVPFNALTLKRNISLWERYVMLPQRGLRAALGGE